MEGMLKRLISIFVVLATAIATALTFGTARGQAGLIGSLLGCPGVTYTQPFTATFNYVRLPGGKIMEWNCKPEEATYEKFKK